MKTEDRYHRAFGVYGVCYREGSILVINKQRGPYRNRFDLPGGSLEDCESLAAGLVREVQEETGFLVNIKRNIGIKDFIVPLNWKEYTHVHHIAVFYKVQIIGGKLSIPRQFEGQDSSGALWLPQNEVNANNSSPLLQEAVMWINSKSIDFNVTKYTHWEVY